MYVFKNFIIFFIHSFVKMNSAHSSENIPNIIGTWTGKIKQYLSRED